MNFLSVSWFSTEGNKENEGGGLFVAFVSFCSNLVFIPPLLAGAAGTLRIHTPAEASGP
jgi:hypothetical protein